MQAAVITENGLKFRMLRNRSLERRSPGAGENGSLNRADLVALQEHAALLRGASGVASSPVKRAARDGVTGLSVGDRVMKQRCLCRICGNGRPGLGKCQGIT